MAVITTDLKKLRIHNEFVFGNIEYVCFFINSISVEISHFKLDYTCMCIYLR